MVGLKSEVIREDQKQWEETQNGGTETGSQGKN